MNTSCVLRGRAASERVEVLVSVGPQRAQLAIEQHAASNELVAELP